jgi:hypothetical protein
MWSSAIFMCVVCIQLILDVFVQSFFVVCYGGNNLRATCCVVMIVLVRYEVCSSCSFGPAQYCKRCGHANFMCCMGSSRDSKMKHGISIHLWLSWVQEEHVPCLISC